MNKRIVVVGIITGVLSGISMYAIDRYGKAQFALGKLVGITQCVVATHDIIDKKKEDVEKDS